MTRMPEAQAATLNAQYPIPDVPPTNDVTKKLLDRRFIQQCLTADDGTTLVRDYHGKRFDREYEPIIEQCREFIKVLDDRIGELTADSREITSRIRSTDRFVKGEIQGNNRPWSAFDLCQLAMYALVFMLLIALGCMFVYIYVAGTNPQQFENQPWSIYLFFAIPLAIPFGFKMLESAFMTDRGKRRYFAAITIVGMVFMIFWIILLSMQVRNILADPKAVIDDLTKSILGEGADTTGSLDAYRHISDKLFLATQLVAEGLCCAAVFIHIQRLASEHESVRRQRNPEYDHVVGDRKVTEQDRLALVAHRLKLIRAIEALKQLRIQLVDRAEAMLRNAKSALDR